MSVCSLRFSGDTSIRAPRPHVIQAVRQRWQQLPDAYWTFLAAGFERLGQVFYEGGTGMASFVATAPTRLVAFADDFTDDAERVHNRDDFSHYELFHLADGKAHHATGTLPSGRYAVMISESSAANLIRQADSAVVHVRITSRPL